MNFDPALGLAMTDLIRLISQGDLLTARKRADTLLERYPEQAELWRLSAICALQSGELDAAEHSLRRSLELLPNSVESLCNLASVFTARGALDEAERALRRALVIEPRHAAALNNLGSLLDARGDYFGAADCFAKAIKIRPDYARAWLNQAAALLAVRQLDRAQSSASRAIALAPQWADAYFVLGNVLAEAGQPQKAALAYRDAIRNAPQDPRYHYQLALLLDEQAQFEDAVRAYETALRHGPDFWPALSQLIYLKRRLCDWHDLGVLSKRLLEGVTQGAAGITPFSLLVEESTPAQQLACAQHFAVLKEAQIAPLQERLAPVPRSRAFGALRVGFVSAGFGEHPTALLLVELIERLKNSGLRTVGFSLRPDDHGPLRTRLRKAFHEWHDLHGQALELSVRTLRDAHLDIVIDMDGYCDGSRPEIYAFRVAPLQVNWLGYPGSLGAPWYDYLIADRVVIPADQRRHYSEKIAWLPRCYQPSDTTRVVADHKTRAHYGLPENAIVFASFNHSWKFTLRSFARWVKILKGTPNAVLWLLSGQTGSIANAHLRRAAQAAGIDPKRFVFAERIPPDEHLARFGVVDLFLDTSPYNAHTTASDALWAGCPVLTQAGLTFASRVAASLNQHLGLTSMTMASDQEYVDRAVFLAHDREALNTIRAQLAKARTETGLFDMTAYARDFESLLTTMAARQQHGDIAADIEGTSA